MTFFIVNLEIRIQEKKEDLSKIMEKLNRSDSAMTLYAEQFIAPTIKFYKRFMSSNFANFH